MSVCVCEKKDRQGNHKCRAVKVEPESGAMTCGRAVELLGAIRESIADVAGKPAGDGLLRVDTLQIDGRALIARLRALGWTVRA